MITRFVGDVIDVWLALARIGRSGRRLWPRLADAWRSWPGDAMARLIMAACGGLQVTREVRLPDGDVALLVEDPRAGLYLDHVPLRPYAQTLGRIILARAPLPDETVRHELEHVRQWRRLGPLFLLVYGLESTRAMLGGGDRYRDNRLEQAARAQEPVAWLPAYSAPAADPTATVRPR